jgi:hypothetical protein
MKTKMLSILFLAGTSLFAAPRVYFGVGVGGYVAPAPVVTAYAPPIAPVAYAPAYARPGYAWVAGYHYPVGPRYVYRPGYWARPPYAGAFWVGPRYYGHRYYPGYWRR